MRIWFEKKDLVYYHHGPLNPALALNLREFGHAELERFKKWLYDEIQRPGFPEGTETVGVFDIANRKTLNTSFSKLPDDCGRFGHLPDFFRSLRLIDGLQIRYRFEDGGEPWLVICQLQQGITWHEIKARLVAKAQEVPLEKKYTLSTDGRLLLKWILELRSDELLIGLTPPVEEHIENDIGIRTDLEAENIPAYIGLLVEEINENTEFNLRIINWHHYTRLQTRISVKKKPADIEYAVRTIQVFGLSKNKLLDHARILAAIKALAGES